MVIMPNGVAGAVQPTTGPAVFLVVPVVFPFTVAAVAVLEKASIPEMPSRVEQGMEVPRVAMRTGQRVGPMALRVLPELLETLTPSRVAAVVEAVVVGPVPLQRVVLVGLAALVAAVVVAAVAAPLPEALVELAALVLSSSSPTSNDANQPI